MASSETRLEGSNTRMTGRGVKRAHPVVLNGLEGTAEEKNSDYLCPVCLDLISEAHITKCGHTFCRGCLVSSIESNKRCPKCNFSVESTDHIFPNHTVNQQILKQRRSADLQAAFTKKNKTAALSELRNYLSFNSSCLGISDITHIISILQEKKEQLEAASVQNKYELMKDFLSELRKQKEEQLATVSRELKLITHDLSSVQNTLESVSPFRSSGGCVPLGSSVPNSSGVFLTEILDGDCPGTSNGTQETQSPTEEGFNVPLFNHAYPESSTVQAKRKRMHLHFEELVERYFSMRVPGFSDSGVDDDEDDGLEQFGECISKFTQYSAMRPLATINYNCDVFHQSSNIASSIEFDKDSEYFAVAGLTKKIRIFDYGTVIRDTVDLHYPCSEMSCSSKISCVSWSNYMKHMLASSDYDGTVTVWDAFTAQRLHVFQEHEKRCWNVDFNKMDTKLIASGSDDHKVKLWSLDNERSLTCLEAKANVCCVQFNPSSRYHLAFGSADHCVHYYDLRNMKEAVRVFKGHRKAVSYVKFVSSEDIVSASTDSLLKIWNVNKSHCVRSLQGHINEKNFVGLATDGEYVACGSENNSLYVYYKGLSKKLFSLKFDQKKWVLDPEQKEEESSEFVSAVCWRKGSNIIAAGNSKGIIKILQMV
ncbi:E3 ubiquitin-protein ligase COP1-like isoform X1 [Panulirus ornatus]|uniref:E3 ubiquitin-protein ligase COP1-like isoform X1 n=1 Tax=Panulirus ornatus TaxID=150431 RepID=UPI003A890177